MSHLSIGLWCEMESGLYMTTSDDQLRSWIEKSLQSTSQSQTCTKKSLLLFSGLLTVWSTTASWIPAKPLYLRSMLSKWMRCTENCNACSWHWSTESTQFSPSNPQLHIAQPTLQSFASSARMGFPGGTSGKESTRQCRRCEFDSESGRSPGVGNGNLLQYSCLENPMDRGTCGLQSIGSQRVGHDWAHMYMPEMLSTMKSEISHDASFNAPIVLNYDPHLLTFLFLWTLRLS